MQSETALRQAQKGKVADILVIIVLMSRTEKAGKKLLNKEFCTLQYVAYNYSAQDEDLRRNSYEKTPHHFP